jgi:mannitol-specific phosphotransferase system IIBC component
MKSRDTLNNFTLGLILGILAPIVTMLIVYFSRFTQYVFTELIDYLIDTQVFTKIVSLCVIPNLILFFVFIWLNYLYSARGVLMATFIFAIFVFVTKFAL